MLIKEMLIESNPCINIIPIFCEKLNILALSVTRRNKLNAYTNTI